MLKKKVVERENFGAETPSSPALGHLILLHLGP